MLGFLPNSSFKTQRWQILAPNPFIVIHKNRKTTGPKVENEIPNIVYVQCILYLLKARTTMDNIFLSHSYTPTPAKISA